MRVRHLLEGDLAVSNARLREIARATKTAMLDFHDRLVDDGLQEPFHLSTPAGVSPVDLQVDDVRVTDDGVSFRLAGILLLDETDPDQHALLIKLADNALRRALASLSPTRVQCQVSDWFGSLGDKVTALEMDVTFQVPLRIRGEISAPARHAAKILQGVLKDVAEEWVERHRGDA
jgi:hypothetical protein